MNTKIILGVAAAVIVIGGGIFFITSDKKPGSVEGGCAGICRQASQACPSLINEVNCNGQCDNLSDESKKHLEESANCEQLSARPDLIADLVVPEIVTPDPIKSDSECEAACGSYVGKCLTLVPNATQALFDEGFESCLQECADWDMAKIDCMISAFDCEAMTNVCGL